MCSGIGICSSVRIINSDAGFFFLVKGNRNRETEVQPCINSAAVNNGRIEYPVLVCVSCPYCEEWLHSVFETQCKLVLCKRVGGKVTGKGDTVYIGDNKVIGSADS